MTNEFWLDGESCLDHGLFVQKHPNITRAKERVQAVTVPGRSGTLTLLQGDDVYDAMTKTCTCAVEQGTDINALTDWLRGSHLVRFGNEPDYQYQARIANQADFLHLFNTGWTHQVAIPFYCQPLKLSYPVENDITLTTSGATVENIGTVTAHPTVYITGTGDITFTIYNPTSLRGNAVIISGLTAGQTIVLDWFRGDCYDFSTGENMNNKVTGNPQFMDVGDCVVSWDGNVSSVKITPHWRWV